MEYSLIGESVKENIVLNKAVDNNEIIYNLKAKNLTPVLQKNNTIIFYDKDDKSKAVFNFKAPFMVDAKNKINDNLKITINNKKSGYEIVMSLDKEWINSSERAFPIKIDPDISTDKGLYSIYDTFVCSKDTENKYTNMFNRVGNTPVIGTARAYIKFILPTLKTGDMITSAYLALAVCTDSRVSTCRGKVNVHRVLQDFDTQNIGWGTQPRYDSNIADYFNMHSSSDNYWASWDITSMMKDWYNSGNNYGIMLEEDSDGGYQSFWSSNIDDSNSKARPFAGIHYINNTGLENYWTYHSQSVGRAGTGYINDYNGNFIFTHDDISMSGNRMPVQINHVFNSNDRDDQLGYGKGWRLNYNQRFEFKNMGEYSYYIYTDGDGTKHYFKYASNQTKYDDELKLGLTLIVESSNTYTIKDKNDNIVNFWSAGDIRYMADNKGNEMNFFYSSSTPNGIRLLTSLSDGANRVTKLDYNSSGDLTTITDPSGKKTSYDYTNRMLTNITYPDGNCSTYGYDGNSDLVSIINNCDGLRMTYEYYPSSPYRIKKVTKSNVDGTMGDSCSVSYGNNTTSFTDSKNRTENYQFDNWGKTLSIKDPDGNAEYYKYTDDKINETKIGTESKLQATIINLMKNPSIEEDRNWDGGSDGGQGSAVISSEDKYYGSRSIKVNKTDNVSRSYSQQCVTVEPGKTYTLSSYAKTLEVSKSNDDGGAYLWVYYMNNKGEYVRCSSSSLTGTNDWQRLQVTFTVPKDTTSNSIIIRSGIQFEKGSAYFDDFQLETGGSANRYNLIENGDFTGSGIPDGWFVGGGCMCDDAVIHTGDNDHPNSLDNCTFRIMGASTSDKRIGQTLKLPGKQGDTYVLSGWAKGNSVPLYNQENRKFAVHAVFLKDGKAVQSEVVPFNQDSTSWQYASGTLVANHDYTEMVVYAIYYYNENSAYFDGMQLYKEEFGQSYAYDDKGNVISTKDLAKKNAKFEYDDKNNLLNFRRTKAITFP